MLLPVLFRATDMRLYPRGRAQTELTQPPWSHSRTKPMSQVQVSVQLLQN